MNDDDNIFIAGDFNLRYLQWVPDDENQNVYVATNVGDFESPIIDRLLLNGLHQISGVKNDNDRSLDLIFAGQCDDAYVCETPVTLCPRFLNGVHHKGMEISIFNFDFVRPKDKSIKFYDFSKANYDVINDELSLVDWSFLSSESDLDTKLNSFYDEIWKVIERNVAVRSKSPSLSQPWLTRELKTLRNKRNKAYRRLKLSRTPHDESTFIYLSKLFHKLNSEAYGEYVAHVNQKLMTVMTDPKSFWKFVNKKRKIDGIPSQVSFLDVTSYSEQHRCDMFADYFESVYQPSIGFDSGNFQHMNDLPKFPSFDVAITEQSVLDGLKSLDVNKGAGPDGLSPLFLRMTAATISSPLHSIFEQSLNSGYFPIEWKRSFLTPVYKSGRRDKVDNYRGIAKISSIPKFFEKLLCDQVTPHVLEIMHPNQHGFEKGKSTVTNLVIYVSSLLEQMSHQSQVDGYTRISLKRSTEWTTTFCCSNLSSWVSISL